MLKTVLIYLKDFLPEIRQNILKEFETTEKEENWDLIPITVVEREVDDPYP